MQVSESESQPDWSPEQSVRLDVLREAVAAAPATTHTNGLLVRLAFDDVADLDLFVTGPDQESVYFANTPSRSGGALLADRRCEDPAPRVELVHFDAPTTGQYRVGVDFHGHCEASKRSRQERQQGLYVVRVDEGGRSTFREGMLAPGRFEVIVLELDVDLEPEGDALAPATD